MNSTTQFPKASTRFRLIAALSLLSALGAVAGLSAYRLLDLQWQTEQTKISAPASRNLAPTAGPALIVYLVDSQEQANWVIGMEQVFDADRADSKSARPDYAFLVLSMATPEGQTSLSEISEAWASQPEGLQIVDMRPRRTSLD